MTKQQIKEIIEALQKASDHAEYESEVLNSSFFLGKRDGLRIAAEMLQREFKIKL